MFKLEYPYFLLLLSALPVFTGLFMLARYAMRKKLGLLGDWTLLKRLIPSYSGTKPLIKFILLCLAWIFFVTGLTDPKTGSKLEKIKRKGIDLVFVLDVSNSMLAQDIVPNRLERSKQAISSLLDQLEDDRVALVVFAGKAYVQMPLTSDFAATRLFLSNINPGMIPVQGTAAGAAIETAIDCFGESKRSKAIVLITDGENHEDDAVAAAKRAASKGIRVYSIGMGLTQGAPIPVYSGTVQIGFKKDASGNTVISKLNEELLSEIASSGDGIFVRASNTSAGVKEVFKHISTLEKKQFDARIFSDYEDRFAIFLFIALLILVVEMIIPNKKSRITDRIRMFNPGKLNAE